MLAVNSLWFKALRCKGDGLCGGSCGCLLARLRLDASLTCGHILPGQWSPMRFECETCVISPLRCSSIAVKYGTHNEYPMNNGFLARLRARLEE